MEKEAAIEMFLHSVEKRGLKDTPPTLQMEIHLHMEWLLGY